MEINNLCNKLHKYGWYVDGHVLQRTYGIVSAFRLIELNILTIELIYDLQNYYSCEGIPFYNHNRGIFYNTIYLRNINVCNNIKDILNGTYHKAKK